MARRHNVGMTELILIRHGETDWNRRQCFQGQIDVPLNAHGLEQAQRLGDRLATEKIDALIVSDLLRARQTAAPLAQRHGLEPHLMPALREQAFGILEGLSFDEIRVKHPAEFALWVQHDPNYALPGGAESRQVFHARVTRALHDVAERHLGQRVAVVTHGGVLDMVWRSAMSLSLHGPRECAIPNTGINRVRLTGLGEMQQALTLELLAWADDAHLKLPHAP